MHTATTNKSTVNKVVLGKMILIFDCPRKKCLINSYEMVLIILYSDSRYPLYINTFIADKYRLKKLSH